VNGQSSIFDISPHASTLKSHYIRMFIDGASRNNPGLAGVGIYIVKDDKPLEKFGYFIGTKTNNQAEYLALIIGLLHLRNYLSGEDLILINSDSELLVRQIKGEYRVKDLALKQLYVVAKRLLDSLPFDIGHVLREDNKVADALANKGIDQHIKVPDHILTQLKEYDISL